MALNQIQAYADMVNLQVAAEAFWRDLQAGSANASFIAQDGNRNNSKEPSTVAALFAPGGRYQLIVHQDLTMNVGLTIPGAIDKSGFSVSIFLDTLTGGYTVSVRSTEFADSIKDLGDARADGIEITDYGWAFGQLNSLENFWRSLRDGTAVNGTNATTIPSAAQLNTFLNAIGKRGPITLLI